MSGSETFFVAVAAIGFLLLLVSFIFGDIEHEMELDGDVDVDANGLMPSWFSMKVLAASAVGFGAFGYTSSSYGLPDFVSWPLALIGLVSIGAGTFYLVLRPIAKLQWNSSTNRESYRGLEGKVTLEITGTSPGAVSFRDRNGSYIELAAELVDEGQLPVGAAVFIVDANQFGVTVMPSSSNPQE